MVLIHASRDILASLESVWDVIADIDREAEFWHGTKSIKNISSKVMPLSISQPLAFDRIFDTLNWIRSAIYDQIPVSSF